MSSSVTIEDIYKLFQNSKEQDDRRAAEFDRRMEESRIEAERARIEATAEADRARAEAKADAERAKADAERAKADADLARVEAKADADRAKADAERAKAEADRARVEGARSMAQLEKTVERTSKAVDALTSRWGRFVEELVEPAVLHLFQSKGIDVKEVYPRARTKRQGVAMEIDILAVDETELVLVECKSRLSKDDVDEFIEKLTRFKVSFPHYKNFQAYGAVAGIEINEGIDRYAYRKGLFVIKPSGEGVKIANDDDFQPAKW